MKCTFSKLIFKFLIFLCFLHVLNLRVHLQEDSCIYSYGMIRFYMHQYKQYSR